MESFVALPQLSSQRLRRLHGDPVVRDAQRTSCPHASLVAALARPVVVGGLLRRLDAASLNSRRGAHAVVVQLLRILSPLPVVALRSSALEDVQYNEEGD